MRQQESSLRFVKVVGTLNEKCWRKIDVMNLGVVEEVCDVKGVKSIVKTTYFDQWS